MKVLETRTNVDGFKRRRYETVEGHRFTTVEIPADLFRQLNTVGRGRSRAAAVLRVIDRERLKAGAIKHQFDGWSAKDSAKFLDIPIRTINRWRDQACPKAPKQSSPTRPPTTPHPSTWRSASRTTKQEPA